MNTATRPTRISAARAGAWHGGGEKARLRRMRTPLAMRTGVVGLLSVLLLGGCFSSGAKSATPSKEQQDQMVQAIKAQIVALPNVVGADVFYTRQAVLQPADLHVGVGVKPGEDFAPIIDAVTRIVWTSPLTPLSGLGIRILHEGAQDAQMVVVNLDGPSADKTLVSKYGPRPSGTPAS